MIGAHRNRQGGLEVRRNEKPLRRKNPSGEIVWIARATGEDGKRRAHGTYRKCGPCKQPRQDGECCAQHRIWWAYEADRTVNPDVLTVGGYFETWLADHPRNPRTEANYRSCVQGVLDIQVDGRAFRDWPMDGLRRKHLNRIVDVLLRDRGRAAAGVRVVMSRLSVMFENAIDDGRLEDNPAAGVRLRSNDPRVRKPRRGVTVASWAEMHALARAAGEREAMIRVLSDCGLRLGEMLGLECRHVRGEVLVVEQSAWHGIITPGTKQSERREVPVPPSLGAMLEPLKKNRIGLLFVGPSGVWQENHFYRAVWRPAVKASGLALRPHDLRHSYVSLMRAAGVDPADLAAWTGHTTMTATSVYTHSTGASFEAARAAVG